MDHLHCYHRSLQSKLIRTEAVNVIRITHEQDHSGRFVDDTAFYTLCNYIFGTCRGTVTEMAITRIALHLCVRSHQIDWDGFPVPMFMTNALCKLCTYRTHSTLHPLQLLAPLFYLHQFPAKIYLLPTYASSASVTPTNERKLKTHRTILYAV